MVIFGPIRTSEKASLQYHMRKFKQNVVAGRGERKDFFDLYTICQEVMDFDDMLRRGFELLPNLNRYHVLRSLNYFQEAEQTPPLRMKREYSWVAVKEFFSRKVTSYLERGI